MNTERVRLILKQHLSVTIPVPMSASLKVFYKHFSPIKM